MSEKKGILSFLGVSNVLEQLKALVDTRVKIIKLELKDELAKFFSNALISLLLINILLFFIFLLSVGVCIYVGELLQSYYLGFFIVAGFYLFLFILLLIFKDKTGLKEFFEKELNKLLNINK